MYGETWSGSLTECNGAKGVDLDRGRVGGEGHAAYIEGEVLEDVVFCVFRTQTAV